MFSKASYVPRRLANRLRHLDRGLFPGGDHGRRLVFAVAAVLLAVSSTGCAVVINKVSETFVSGNSVYATDDDPDLVWEAVPFGLKTMEGLLVQAPKNKNLLLAASSGFTQYGYGHLQQDADFLEANDFGRRNGASHSGTQNVSPIPRLWVEGSRGRCPQLPRPAPEGLAGSRQQVGKDARAAPVLDRKRVGCRHLNFQR